MRSKRLIAAGALLLVVTASAAAAAKFKFKPDDPIATDPDQIPGPMPTSRSLSKSIDLLQKTFTRPSGEVEAQNINTLGEVPDSSWYTNRMSLRLMSIEDLVRGPDRGDGPDLSAPWTIVAAKTEGITPGFRIKDAKGGVYFIKFDPLHWKQMATSAEVVGTKFFHAFGYNVAENYLVRWKPEYALDRKARVLWESGKWERITRGYVEETLERVPRNEDGTIWVLASKFLPGRPIGPFDLQDTRKDDPNDIIPHQDRRELRGYQVFCAWMNHNDSDSVNTLDMYEGDPKGKGIVRHNLIDFGTVMGSGAVAPHARRVGNEYYIAFKPSLAAAATLGIWDRPWRHVKFEELPSVGRFESSYFDPAKWVLDYPSPAGDRMTAADALWATRTVMRFDDERIRAMVKTGRYEDPRAEDLVSRTLIERRDKIVRHYLALTNPLDRFEVGSEGGVTRLGFHNLGAEAGLASSCSYGYEWFRFDNDSGTLTPIGASATTASPSVPVPGDAWPFLMVRIATSCRGGGSWSAPVEVYLRNGAVPSPVGIDRGPMAALSGRK